MSADQKYLLHILECIRRIEEDLADGEEIFLRSHMVQDAVIRNLQVLAESVKRLSPAIKGGHLEIDWPGIAGLRNLLVHDYFGVDLGIVWRIVKQDIPELKSVVRQMLR